jgi:sterol desaturase/sphingolipid hydroxylase (fatty acid hydroxylase superfamily)
VSWVEIESRAHWFLFIVAFLSVAAWESRRPKRKLHFSEGQRWTRHGILMIVWTVVVTAVYRSGPAAAAIAVGGSRWGALNKSYLPFAMRCVLGVLLLDLVNYATHRLFHAVPFLWRIHQVHHSDPDFDVSTSLRFHPFELIVTQGAYLAAIVIFAPPVIAVLIAGVGASVASLFEHANTSLPARTEQLLRAVLITPDVHRLHHSDRESTQNRNFGEIFPWWDRMFRTYMESTAVIGEVTPGLMGFPNSRGMDLFLLLGLPFRRQRRVAGTATELGTQV